MEKKDKKNWLNGLNQGISKHLCENYQLVLYNTAYKLLLNNEDVADCLQETEIRAWHNINNLEKNTAFNSWIFKIMLNIAKDILKKKRKTIEFEEKYLNLPEYIDQSGLSETFEHLPEKYKIPIILHYYAGFNLKEIANK